MEEEGEIDLTEFREQAAKDRLRSQQISTAQKLQNHVHTLFIPGYHIVTSSTAQGGGGSFKNRKPIGELGCCESGMAERSH